jgi:hypothetical protein
MTAQRSFRMLPAIVGLMALPTVALAQAEPDAAAMAEHASRMQLEQQQIDPPAQAPVDQMPTAQPPGGLAPTIDIVPGGQTSPTTMPSPSPEAGGNGRGPRGGTDMSDRRGPRDDINRQPDPRYRDRAPRYDDDRDRHPRDRRYRPPSVIVRPYYPPPVIVTPPPVIVRPYNPPPVYVPPPHYAPRYVPPPVWAGTVPGSVVWSLFPDRVYDSLPGSARLIHERAYVAALSGPLGLTQSWRLGSGRGEVTVIDELYVGSSFCRDVVQTIRFPGFGRTVDGRVCLRPGQSWRLVAY